MRRIFDNKKRVFWEALLITIAVFMMGMLSGVAFENSRLDKVNEYFAQSEVSLIDSLAIKDLLASEGSDLSCETALEYNRRFADRIYNESLSLSKYEESSKITDNIKIARQKYDALRTILWITNRDLQERCSDYNYVVYLYDYESKDTSEKAENKVWSRILYDLKIKKGSNVVLIPIAVTGDLASLGAMVEEYGLEEFPAVIINDEEVLTELESVEDLEEKLKGN